NPVREFLLPSVLRGNVRPNWCTLAGMSSGMSMVVYIAVLGGGLILFFLSGCGGYEVCSGDKVLRMLWWLCAAVAAAMLVLFVLFRTEETAYRYAVIGHSYDWGGDDEMAIANFQKSLQLDPNNPLVSNDLSLIMMRRAGHGDPKKGTGR
ncbi:MAG: tetratricopeptide repeat protein, partial [Candidatus Aureabacteria bacterium]|nr:tetratricopeptide repeat protein [Candidatus Auribacterota bacterium]